MVEDEILDVVNMNDQVIGNEYRSELYNKCSQNFRVINAFLKNKNNQLWIPRRTANKLLFPLCLDVSVGGHVRSGEGYREAFYREAEEEINLDLSRIPWKRLGKLTPYINSVSAFMEVYEIYTENDPEYNPDDFVECFWLKPREILSMISQGVQVKDDLPKLIKFFYV